MSIVSYDPPLEQHPAYRDDHLEASELSEGDAVNILAYNGMKIVDHETNASESYLTDDVEGDVITPRYVEEVDGFKLKVKVSPRATMGEWIPETRVHSRCLYKQAQWEQRRRDRRRYQQRVDERKGETDMDTMLNEVVIPHAQSKVDDVWSGGSVDVDAIHWFWNTRLSNSAGMAYHGSAVPKKIDSRYAVGLAPAYYYQHGVDELLEVVRHELIHQWEYQHPDGGRGGHGPKFKQWVSDMDTHRHCKHWSK